jgi:hypothetical protein
MARTLHKHPACFGAMSVGLALTISRVNRRAQSMACPFEGSRSQASLGVLRSALALTAAC